MSIVHEPANAELINRSRLIDIVAAANEGFPDPAGLVRICADNRRTLWLDSGRGFKPVRHNRETWFREVSR
jgi:hypothetical protein